MQRTSESSAKARRSGIGACTGAGDGADLARSYSFALQYLD
jgi:hypothetical protein